MNIVERILCQHSEREHILPGEIVMSDVDLVMGNELSTIVAISEFEKAGIKRVFDQQKIVFVFDHFVPAKDIQTAQLCQKIRNFAKKHGIKIFEIGKGGIEHVVIPEEGLALPYQLIIGGDSHTTTYGGLGCFSCGVGSTDMAFAFATGKIWLKVPEVIKIVYKGSLQRWVYAKDVIMFTISELGVDGARYKAVEFEGEVIKNMDVDERLTLCNMSAEMGAKSAIVTPDEKTLQYLAKIGKKFDILPEDEDKKYSAVYEFDISSLEPLVACPPSPADVVSVSKVEGIKVDQVLIGSCTNGRIGDLRIAAEFFAKGKVHPDVRCLIIPGSQKVFEQALREGLIEVFIKAGGAVSTPTCGPCIGGHMGVLASGEVCVSTTNRNFVGRMGHKEAKVYLSNPAVASACAIAGKIISPSKIFE
jgi:3-isopropylmalate/(R)-2-methylmalate dehydratase large subunit